MNITNEMMNDPANRAPADYYKKDDLLNMLKRAFPKESGQSTPGGDVSLPNPLGMPGSNDEDLVAAMQLAIMGQPKQKSGGLNIGQLLSSFSG